jgi:hypothetical protein
MAENKDSTPELDTELENMGDLNMELGLNNEVSADMVELKNRMDKADQEIRAMTAAMKSTLLDVRTLMQDMDNPFNMLRDMGVDKLVTVAVETVEDEVNARAGAEEAVNDPVVVSVERASTSNPSAPVASNYIEPRGGFVNQTQAPVINDYEQPVSTSCGAKPRPASPAVQGAQYVPSAQNPVESITGGSTDMAYFDERMAQTEEAVNQIAGSVNELAKAIRESNKRKPINQPQYQNLSENFVEGSDYYEAYVSLIADYLQIRLGEKGSEEVLLEGMYKEWASPKVVRDIMDKLSSSKKQGKKTTTSLDGLSDVEDKMLITSLLRNLNKPVSEWGESTHLFLLLALVSRARENQANRS